MPKPRFPDVVSRASEVRLREVGPGVFVGGQKAIKRIPRNARRWEAVVDLYGSSGDKDKAAKLYNMDRVSTLLRLPVYDGTSLPGGVFDAILPIVAMSLPQGPVLIHCQAGLSRSASVAYAMLRALGKLSHEEARARVEFEPGWPRVATLESAKNWVHRRGRSIPKMPILSL